MDRRTFLRSALLVPGAAAFSAACGNSDTKLIAATDPRVAELEAARGGGTVVPMAMKAGPVEIDLGGPVVKSWAYGDSVPHKPIRITKGDVVEATFTNNLPTQTTVHWHGLALRNDMDGVPMITQQPIASGEEFTYKFVADIPGTYWFHPHMGTQLDRGLYAALIIEDPDEKVDYDEEWVLVLDDWLDGVNGVDPDAVFAEISKGMAHHHEGDEHGDGSMDHSNMDMGLGARGLAKRARMADSPSPSASPSPGMKMDDGMKMSDGGSGGVSGMLMGARSALLGGDAGDVAYPHHLINGRAASDPEVFQGKPGEKVRIRIINAGSDTGYRFAVGGHTMTVTHSDGFPVDPVETDSIIIGMAERYDVVVTLKSGVFPVVAEAEGKNQLARAIIRTARKGQAPGADHRPAELDKRILNWERISASESARLAERDVDRDLEITMTGGMEHYDWGINGKRYDMADPYANDPFVVEEGERVRVKFFNDTEMWHPMHLHGHTFQVGASGPRKDTVIVLPRQEIVVDFDANNPGQWMVHCHNTYHTESGMMALLGYKA